MVGNQENFFNECRVFQLHPHQATVMFFQCRLDKEWRQISL